MNKPEIGSKWRCTRDIGLCVAGDVYCVAVRVSGAGWRVTRDGVTLGLMPDEHFTNGLLVPLSPAPAEPAKTGTWTPKPGDRVVASGIVKTARPTGTVGVVLDGMTDVNAWSMPAAALRPESESTAAAPAGECMTVAACLRHGLQTDHPHCKCSTVAPSSSDRRDTIPAPAPPTGAEILSESRQHRMRIADLEGDLAKEKAEKAALASQVSALRGDVALARRERDGWRAKYQRRDGR